MTTLLTFPVQLIAFAPGRSTGNSPLMALFMDVTPEYASMIGVSSVILPAMPLKSAMLIPTMSVMVPEP